MVALRPMKAIRANCLDCSGSAKAVAYCSCDGVNSTPCHLWPYRFGCRPETAKQEFGEAMLMPELMPGPNVELDSLPKNPRDYRPLGRNIAEKAVEGNERAVPGPGRKVVASGTPTDTASGIGTFVAIDSEMPQASSKPK